MIQVSIDMHENHLVKDENAHVLASTPGFVATNLSLDVENVCSWKSLVSLLGGPEQRTIALHLS